MQRLSLRDINIINAVVMSMISLTNGGPVQQFSDADLELAERVLEGDDDSLERFFDEVDADGLPDFGVRV